MDILPAGSISMELRIVKKNSETNNANNIQENISINEFLECIEFIIKYILSQKRKRIKQKMKFYTLDRTKSLSLGQKINLQNFNDISPSELQEHLDFLFPNGVSKHGDQYIASKLKQDNQVNGLIEIIFEFIRRSHFQNKPSRMQSIFAFDSIKQVEDFRQRFGNNDSIIWEIESDEFFKVDMDLLCLAPSGLIISNNAHKYWSGLAGSENPHWEYLLLAPVKIIGKV